MKQKKPIKPVKAWAATLADEPQIFSVSLHREDMPEHFKHIRVMVTPIEKKRKKPVAGRARGKGIR